MGGENMEQNKELSLETKNKIEEYVEWHSEELYKHKSVVLLKHMSKEEAEYVFDLVRKKGDIIARTIEYKSLPVIFLKYHKQSENVDWKKLINQAQIEYNKGHLDESLHLYRQILQIIPRPRSFIFYRTGLLYLKHQQKKAALLYLNIALGLSKKEDMKHTEELEGMIFNITNSVPLEEQKDTRYINMSEDDFLTKNENSKIEDIAALIKADNLDINDTCNSYNLSSEEVLLVKLICARNNYASKNFVTGDRILKEVEKAKDKTKVVKSLLKDITVNKKMYQYRQNPKEKKKISS